MSFIVAPFRFGGGGGSGGSFSSATVTVDATKISSTLTDFVLMIDLSDMPSVFWDDVRSDGGNIRVYQSDGTTLIPHDAAFMAAGIKKGRLFCKITLSDSSDTDVVVKLEDDTTTKIAAGDPNGQYDVWGDYVGVIVAPDAENRVNGAAPTRNEWLRGFMHFDGYIDHPDGEDSGIATDATHYYTVGPNLITKRLKSDDSSVSNNTDPIGDSGVALITELTGGHVVRSTGKLHVIARGTGNEHVLVFNTSNLSYDTSYDLGGDRDRLDLTYDGTDWFIIRNDDDEFEKFDGSFTSSVDVFTPVNAVRNPGGITWMESPTYGNYLLTSGSNTFSSSALVNRDGTVGIEGFNQKQVFTSFETIDYDVTEDRAYSMSQPVARLYKYSMDENAIGAFRMEDNDRSEYSISNVGDTYTAGGVWKLEAIGSADQHQFMRLIGNSIDPVLYRNDSPQRLTLLDVDNGTLEESLDLDIFGSHHFALRNVGSSRRDIYRDKSQTAVDTGITAQNLGAGSTNWRLGDINDGGRYLTPYVWLRKEDMSDAWLDAEYDNWFDRGAFYTVVSEVAEEPDGPVLPPPVSGGDYIVLLIGGANMLGNSGPIDDPGQDSTNAAQRMVTSAGDTLVTLEHPIPHLDTPAADTVGMGMQFAKEIAVDKSANTVTVVGLAMDASGFGLSNSVSWRAHTGGAYSDAQTRWNAAWAAIRDAYPDAGVTAVVMWIGDEEIQNAQIADFYNSTIETTGYDWLATKMNLMDAIRRNWIGMTDDVAFLPITLPDASELTGDQDAWDNIQTGVLDVVNVYPRAAGVDADTLAVSGDNLTLTAGGMRTLGVRAATALGVAEGSATAVTAPPAFVPEAGAVQTLFAFDWSNADEGAPIRAQAGRFQDFQVFRSRIGPNNTLNVDQNSAIRFPPTFRPELTNRDFVLKCTMKADPASPIRSMIVGSWNSDPGNNIDQMSWMLHINGNGYVAFSLSNNGSTFSTVNSLVGASTFSFSDWEVRRVGTNVTISRGGVQQGSTLVLPSGYTVHTMANDIPPTERNMMHVGGTPSGTKLGIFSMNEWVGEIQSVSLEFLS